MDWTCLCDVSADKCDLGEDSVFKLRMQSLGTKKDQIPFDTERMIRLSDSRSCLLCGVDE